MIYRYLLFSHLFSRSHCHNQAMENAVSAPGGLAESEYARPVNRFARRSRKPRPVPDQNEPEETENIDESSLSKEQNDGVEHGMFLESKDLYRSNPRQEWTVWSPDDLENGSQATASEKFALIIKRERIQQEDGSVGLSLHSLQVQSPLIREMLSSVFGGYPGINTNLKKLQFNAPFREFYYRWREFSIASKNSKADEITAAHFALLFDIISAQILPHIDVVKDLMLNNAITYDYLWALFEPGMEVYSVMDKQHRLYRLLSTDYVTGRDGTKYFRLTCQHIDTDGTRFGYVTTNLSIGSFADVLPTTSLQVLPAYLKPGIDEIRTRLRQRGKAFESLRGCHYKSYSGDYKLAQASFGRAPVQTIEDGRIIVDCEMFCRYNRSFEKRLDALDEPISTHQNKAFGSALGIGEHDDDSDLSGAPPAYQILVHSLRESRRRQSDTTLSDEHYVFCTATVHGFCLRSKQWVTFNVDNVKEIIWNKEAFDRLSLPHDYKRLIRGLVHTQLNANDSFDDVVSGKGRGIVMLLSGEPGTGKTLTAESVSEVMRRPLYSMAAGELGDTADAVENNLQRVLETSTKWSAVLLLDECDVFLEKRSIDSVHMQRNKIVSVFLRLLEYYQGVMLLTTNRVDSFDPAFESRIHLTIDFPKLDFQSRLQVWRTFVRPGNTESNYASDLSHAEIEKLALAEMNGRQIRNIVKTARLLAAGEQSRLALGHIEAVLRVKQGVGAQLDVDMRGSGEEEDSLV
ncbi:unnamed protein product [Periconia digitata]|uniref:AAA+ ATPase domain-containing protein n=1 Tax=Periconia digitata TaxID=1303443 RepID=A0A9W4U548_9PLEO|nr:unnamed protein product [Periconia digitata]